MHETSDVLPIPGSVLPDPQPDAFYFPPGVLHGHVTYLDADPPVSVIHSSKSPGMTRGEAAEVNARLIAEGHSPLFLTNADADRLFDLRLRDSRETGNLLRRLGRHMLGRS